MGTQDHTKLLFRQFNALSKVKIVGFVNFFNKTDFSSNDKININNIKIKNIHKTRFDEIDQTRCSNKVVTLIFFKDT